MFQYEGKHLLIDAVCDHQAALVDVEMGKAALAEMATAIGMTMVMEPSGVQFPVEVRPLGRDTVGDHASSSTTEPTAGYSAFVMLAESHISLHTFPEAAFLTVDCYSCKDFDHENAIACLHGIFQLRERNVQVVKRRFPTLSATTPAVSRPAPDEAESTARSR